MVSARGIAVIVGEIRQHRIHHPRITAGGGVVIQIDRKSNHNVLFSLPPDPTKIHATPILTISEPGSTGWNSSLSLTSRSTSRIRLCTAAIGPLTGHRPNSAHASSGTN